jgi:hypothetical protein
MKQSNINAFHELLAQHVQLWTDGLVTDKEFVDVISTLSEACVEQKVNFTGLICPNTGLRYI